MAITWLGMLIPVGMAILLYVFFKKKTCWWEFLIPFSVSLILIPITQWIAFSSLTDDIEYFGNYAVEAKYYEDWNELVHYTVTVSDGKGKSHTEHRTRVDYHPPRWLVILDDGDSWSIDKEQYKNIIGKWKNEKFTDIQQTYP